MTGPKVVALPTDLPIPGALPPLHVGTVSRTVLQNGVEVMVVPRHTVPRVEFRLSVPAGDAVAPAPAEAALLQMGIPLGTRDIDQEQLSERLHQLGGSLQVQVDHDNLTIHSAALAEAEEELYHLLDLVVEAPEFPGADLATEKAKLIEALQTARATPDFPADEALVHLIYGDHPYGRSEPSDAQVRRVRRQSLLELHRRTFVPSGAQITVVGDVEPRATMRMLRRAFSDWSGPRRIPRAPRVRASVHPELLFIDRPGSVQTVIMAAASGPTRGEEGHVALALATSVLGGGFTSRLMSNLREEKGYTYSPHARLQPRYRDGLAVASMQVRSEVTAAALVEVRYELARLSTLPVPQEELETTKRYLIGARLVMLQTQAGLASALAQVRSQGLDHRYLERYQKEVELTSPAAVMEAARRYLSPTAVTTVLVGDPSAATGLEALGQVRRRRG